MTFELQTPEGARRTATLTRNRNSGDYEWLQEEEQSPLSSFEMLADSVGHLSLNSFGNDRIADEFREYLPRIQNCESLIIDLRENGGGSSNNGYEILQYFQDEPVLTSAWRTREQRAAFMAWGKPYANQDPATLNEWNRDNRAEYLGQRWYRGQPDTIPVLEEGFIDVPVVVLVSNSTASAAEDFLVAADALDHFTFVGEPSCGSTGQPLMLSMPNGGSARVCT